MKIKVSNFLAYSKPVEFDLRKTNLFIGGNNCGKSTFSKLIFLMQSMDDGFSDGDLSFGLHRFQEFFPNILSFDDLVFNSKKPISVSIEFPKSKEIMKVVKIDLSFFQNNSYHIDDHGIQKGGMGIINSILIDNELFYSRIENNVKFFLTGLRSAKLIMEGFYDTLELDDYRNRDRIKKLKASINLFGEEIRFNENGIVEINDQFGNLYDLFIKPRLSPFLDLLKEKLFEFSLMLPGKYVESLNQYERGGIIDSIKDHFGAEILYRDIFRGTGRNNTELKVIRKETFVSYKNNEVPLEAMGLGFRNLYRILCTKASYSWDAFVNQKGYFPIFEEPEIGLHPDWQVKLFKLLKRGIIETHSLIILRALQLEVAEGNFSSDDVMIHNFYRDENDEIEVKQIRILKSGILSDDFESGFQDELVQIEHKLWQIQQKLINRN